MLPYGSRLFVICAAFKSLLELTIWISQSQDRLVLVVTSSVRPWHDIHPKKLKKHNRENCKLFSHFLFCAAHSALGLALWFNLVENRETDWSLFCTRRCMFAFLGSGFFLVSWNMQVLCLIALSVQFPPQIFRLTTVLTLQCKRVVLLHDR